MKIQLVLSLMNFNDWYNKDGKTTIECFVSSPFSVQALSDSNFTLDLFQYIHNDLLLDNDYFEQSEFVKAIRSLQSYDQSNKIDSYSYTIKYSKDKLITFTAHRVEEQIIKFIDLKWEKK